MVKRVFEGFVNGQKFDNVEDYNKAVDAVLKNGGVLEACTKTYTEVVEDEQLKGVNFHNFGDMDFLPDVNLDNVTDDNSAKKFCTYLTALEDNLHMLQDVNSVDLTTLLNNIDVLEKKNQERGKITDQATKAVEDKIEEYENKLKTLYRSQEVIDKLDEYYHGISRYTQDILKSREGKKVSERKVVSTLDRKTSQAEKVRQLLREIGLTTD